jgi:indolepyruvate ferredoxin oxidoreductase alpha subunit
MERFNEIVASEAGSKFILQGNEAFALGVIHAGFHAAEGYPGTPSTEVIDKSLKYVQDLITVGWSVNEAVAVGVAIGHSIAGSDAVVTICLLYSRCRSTGYLCSDRLCSFQYPACN